MGKNILVVDDEVDIRGLVKATLEAEEEGYQIDEAGNGVEALSLVKEKKYDLIILDIMMPEMDGIETCHQLKEDEVFKNIPIIFLTVKSQFEFKSEGFEVGGVAYLTKPFDPEELARLAKGILAGDISP